MKIIFPLQLYLKLCAYIQNVETEINGIGKVRVEENNIHVEDIRIFPQEVSGTHATLDRKGLMKFFDDLTVKGESIAPWKLFWHSHCDMEAYLSTIDIKTTEEMDNETAENNWTVALVMNKKFEYQVRVQVFQPFPFVEESVELEVQYPIYEDMLGLLQEIKDNVLEYIPNFDKKKTKWFWKNGHYAEYPVEEQSIHAIPRQTGVAYNTEKDYDNFNYRKEFKKKYKKRNRQ